MNYFQVLDFPRTSSQRAAEKLGQRMRLAAVQLCRELAVGLVLVELVAVCYLYYLQLNLAFIPLMLGFP